MAGRNWTERHIRELIRKYLRTLDIKGGGETTFSDVGIFLQYDTSHRSECYFHDVTEQGQSQSWLLFKNRTTTLDVTDAFKSICSLTISSNAYDVSPEKIAIYNGQSNSTIKTFQHFYYIDTQNKKIYIIPSNVFNNIIELNGMRYSDYPNGEYRKTIFTGNSLTYLSNLLTIINAKFPNTNGILTMFQFDNHDNTANQIIDINMYLKYILAPSGTYTYDTWT